MTLLALAALFAKSYLIEGLVISVDRVSRVVVISHKEIPGVMPAMAMPVQVRDARDLNALRPGVAVEFRLENGAASHWKVRRTDNAIEEDGRRVAIPPPKERVEIGAPVPDFALTDQSGAAVRLSDFRGRVVAIQFLYTRCPLPEVCPRLAATFARIARRFESRLGKDLALLTITLDPQYDSPEVLSRYAGYWRADGVNWRFLTGTAESVRAAAASFGLVYWPEDGVITHTSTVALVGRSGSLESTVEGLSFDARQLGDWIEHFLNKETTR